MNTAKISKTSGTNTPIVGDGLCFDAFLKKLEKKHGQSVRDSVRGIAETIVQDCVNTYAARFGPGDVGAKGTGTVAKPFRPSEFEQIPNQTTGLLYGKVQSGKTNAAMATVALGLANGFKSFIVLTSDNVLLGKQTLDRFRASLGQAGPRVCGWTDLSENPGAFGKELSTSDRFKDTGVVFVSTKNQAHLSSLLTALKTSGAARFPTIVIDDEADHASLNTHTARNAKRGSDDASTIFERIGDIREAIPNHIYLQITATPQSLLLQSLEHPSKPVFCVLVPPGDGYIGGDIFFSDDATSLNHRVEVDAAELSDLKGGAIDPGDKTVTPKGLRLALCTFFAGAIQKQIDDDGDDERYTLLVHISQKQQDFRYLAKVIQQFITNFDKSLRGKNGASKEAEVTRWLEEGHKELRKTCGGLRPLADIVAVLKTRLTNVSPVIIDADAKNSQVEYREGMNILVGGNRLGRGLTIDGLMVTYYGRDPKTPMSDTVHQHARMFGYRQRLLDVTRLFSTPHLLDGFKAIHEADEGTRKAIGDDPQNLLVKPVWVGSGIKPTRSNVLNPADVGALTPGVTIYPPDPKWKRSETEEHFTQLDKLLGPYTGDEVYHQVSINFLGSLLLHMPSRYVDNYTWEDGRVREVLKALEKVKDNPKTGRLNVRRGKDQKGLQLKRQDPPWKGFITASWASRAKDLYGNEPTLIVTMQEGAKRNSKGEDMRWEGSRVYLPSLVLPSLKFVFMFNYT